MFNPITASQEIKDAFTDYITTTFDFADIGTGGIGQRGDVLSIL